MGYSLYLLTASFLAAQGDVVLVGQKAETSKMPQPEICSTFCSVESCCRSRLFARGRGCNDGGCCRHSCCERRGLLARLFGRRCGGRCGLFSFLRRNRGCCHRVCDAVCDSGSCGAERCVVHACCRRHGSDCEGSCGHGTCHGDGGCAHRCRLRDRFRCDSDCGESCHRCRLFARFRRHRGCDDHCDGPGFFTKFHEQLCALPGHISAACSSNCPQLSPGLPPHTAPCATEKEADKKKPIKAIPKPELRAQAEVPQVPQVPEVPEFLQVSSHVEVQPVPDSPRNGGHDADFRSITGELRKIDGIWVVRYASSDAANGSEGYAILFSEVDMTSFREGDMVSVRGNVISASSTEARATHYRVSSVELIER